MYEPTYEWEIVLQTTWIQKAVTRCLQHHLRFSATDVEHHFIHPSHKKHVRETPIIRVYRYLKTTDQLALTAIVSDTRHLIFAKFPYDPTIIKFEQLYRQRLTYMTAGCLFVIKQAKLRFAKPGEVAKDFDFSISPNIQIVILEIDDFTVFSRDQAILPHEALSKVNMIYYDREYYDLCGRDCYIPEYSKDVEKQVSDDYGDVVSV
ncbi:hypothetical protein PGUG_02612 [Meyerozyma guilliermondii ATCC 6260]|uniref:Telomere replication protein EST3 n=1 Tax=Meyerozyma guilliermondii (strain ATCC 6260 / CBS 566 / DSM 6381 / JCM 1539 / NBRC 10279 / NRRL Y-324) TaxID=294746 RepID=A5DH61_PICGU|nr:uncharacterized protein PGUG_02612 [Meyerozyma guilliermondii ATCC 6260]EDK38514.2 hypothetical protein PGUG_02612 [Meyerozyma guilliermondii ATCC 6260]